MVLQNAGEHMCDGMGLKIRRNVSDPDAIMRITLAIPQGCGRGTLVCHPDAGAAQFICRRQPKSLSVERRDNGLALVQLRDHELPFLRQLSPIATVELAEQTVAARKGREWIELKQTFVIRRSVLVAAQREQDGGAVEDRLLHLAVEL